MTDRPRFPGASGSWARFDAPAGTQMVDTAIEAMTAWMTSGSTAAAGGWFAAADECAALQRRTRAVIGELFNADPSGVAFGPNMTTMTLALSRAVGATLRAGQRIVGTRLDHDANVTPWRLAAEQAGADHVLVGFDPVVGTLDPNDVIAAIDERTAWVTLPGASNLLGSAPDLAPIVAAAHSAGAKVFVDAVALAPHQPIDVAALDCDVLVTSPYKWYGPHSGVMIIRPELVDEFAVFKVRPATDHGPGRHETGMPNFEALAGIAAAASYLIEIGMDQVAADEAGVFARLLDGLAARSHVTRYGLPGVDGRTPTVAFSVAGHDAATVCRALAAAQIAAWDGHNYAVEAASQLGVDPARIIRAGIARYTSTDDVDRLLATIDTLR